MLILLPPSEGKAAPSAGPPVELETLAFAAALTESRRNLLGALERLVAEPRQRAVAMLGLSSAQAGEVEVNAQLRGAPAAPAAEVYTGRRSGRRRIRRTWRRRQASWSSSAPAASMRSFPAEALQRLRPL